MLVIKPDLEPLPGYRIIQRLGRGGCGEVWKAEAPGGVFKAIKFVFGDSEGITQDNRAAEQEQRSLQRVKNIRHPFILTTERFEVVEGQLVIVMELADGSLAERFDQCMKQNLPGIPRDELIRYMEEAAEALDLMNTTHQIQHMDIKPQNIFLVQQHVKVGDFGLAKNLEGTRAALTGGMTPIYASPESFDGWVSHQSDQYSLAIVYQEMLTGKRPFTGVNSRQLIMQHLTAAPDLSPLSPADRAPVSKALSKRPEDRFVSCLDFVKALRSGEYSLTPAARKSGHLARPGEDRQTLTQQIRRSTVAVVPNGRPTPVAIQPEILQRPTAPPPRQSQGKRSRNGVLFPAIVIGVGAAGLAIVQQHRRFMFDRHRVSTLAHLRHFYIDCDPAAMDAATNGRPEVRLSEEEVFAVEVPPADPDGVELTSVVTDTRIGDETFGTAEPLLTGRWIRTMQANTREQVLPLFLERIRVAIQEVAAVDSLVDASRQTQLDVRSKTPRIYLAADLGNRFASTVLIDLAYALKNEMRALGHNSQYLVGLVALPAKGDSDAAEFARQALNDLEYFDRSDTVYKVGCGAGGQLVTDGEPPFGRCLLFEDEAALAHAGHLLFAESFTAAGQVFQSIRCSKEGHHYFAANVRRVLWPRGAVVDGAARQLAHNVVESWASSDSRGLTQHAEKVALQFWRERRLDLALVRAGLEYGTSQRLRGPLESALQEKLELLGVGLEPLDLISGQVALDQMAEWLKESAGGNGRIAAAFEERGLEIAADIDLKLAPLVASLLEQPGQRVAGARELLRVLEAKLKAELEHALREAQSVAEDVRTSYEGVRERLAFPAQSGKSQFRKQFVPGDFGEKLKAWGQNRIRQMREDMAGNIYAQLLAAIPEFVREVETLTDRLDSLAHQMDTAADSGLPADGVCEYLFPFGAHSVEEAIQEVVNAIGESGRREFDDSVQSKLRSSGVGVIQLGVRPEWGAKLVKLITGEAGRFVEERTNRLSVSQALHKHFDSPAEMKSYVNQLLQPSEDSLVGKHHELTIVGVPEDLAGQTIADLVRKLSDDPTVMSVPSPEEIVLGRLSGGLSISALRTHLDSRMPESVQV